MNRLLALFALLLPLLFAAAPAYGVMLRAEKSAVPDFFWPSQLASGDEPPCSQDCTMDAAIYGYDFAEDVRVGPNLYAYVVCNPWSKFDPDGLAEQYIIMGGVAVGDPGHDNKPLNFFQAMDHTLNGMSKAERKNTEVVIYGPAYRERALSDAKAEIAKNGSTKLTENTYLDMFKKEAQFRGAKVSIAESAKDVVTTMGKAADGEIKNVKYFGHSGPLHDGKLLALDYHSNGATSFGKENITANDIGALKDKFAAGGKFEHRGCHGGFPGGFCQDLSKQVPQIETEGATLRSDYSNIWQPKATTPALSKVIPEGSAEKGVTKNEWVKYEKGERKNQ